MKKNELIEAISEKNGLTKKDTTEIINCLFETITEALKKGEEVDITGFGKFKVNNKAARTGVNPATGEKIKIEACKAPSFKAGKALKEAVK